MGSKKAGLKRNNSKKTSRLPSVVTDEVIKHLCVVNFIIFDCGSNVLFQRHIVISGCFLIAE